VSHVATIAGLRRETRRLLLQSGETNEFFPTFFDLGGHYDYLTTKIWLIHSCRSNNIRTFAAGYGYTGVSPAAAASETPAYPCKTVRIYNNDMAIPSTCSTKTTSFSSYSIPHSSSGIG